MAELGSQRAAAAADAAGKAAVYKLERDLSALESSIVLEPYTGEDLKEILKAAEVPAHWLRRGRPVLSHDTQAMPLCSLLYSCCVLISMPCELSVVCH